MSSSIYITATEAESGRSLISLGLMEMLLRQIRKVGYFRPLIKGGDDSNERDARIQLISSHFNLDIPYEKMHGFNIEEARTRAAESGQGEVLEGIMRKFRALKETCDFVLCEGTDFESASATFEFDINAEISKNLGCPVLLVAKAWQKTVDDVLRSTRLAMESLAEKVSNHRNDRQPGGPEKGRSPSARSAREGFDREATLLCDPGGRVSRKADGRRNCQDSRGRGLVRRRAFEQARSQLHRCRHAVTELPHENGTRFIDHYAGRQDRHYPRMPGNSSVLFHGENRGDFSDRSAET